MKAVGIPEDIIRGNRNPLLALHQILEKTVMQFLSTDAERARLRHQLMQFGIPSTLSEVAIAQCKIDMKRHGKRPSADQKDRQMDKLLEWQNQKLK